MKINNHIRRIAAIAGRECVILLRNPVYWFCMVIFPVSVMLFFTSLMDDGQPQEMPVGVVDLDNSSTSRSLIRNLDAFQTTRITGRYASVAEAREAIQRNEIYAFLYIPEGMASDLLASRRPKISFYYSMTSLTAGALVFRDLKTISTLGSAAVGKATLSARGFTSSQIQAFLQPIRIDLHQISNPWTNYNIYLSTMLVPGVIMLFIFLITAYSIGTELKFGRSRHWLRLADNDIVVAIIGKLLPQTLIFLAIVSGYMYYVFGMLQFPHHGGFSDMLLLGLMTVLPAQGFGVFVFGLFPSLRMSMSICSLWAVLSFSIVGSAFPVSSMDSELQALSWLFPLRHYFMAYQVTVFNGYPVSDAWLHIVSMLAFTLLPVILLGKIKNAMLNYVYIP
ncbi:ABC transporter permease [Xylanibacter muris]|uniref:ABC transporter permease n=1 Tax=Xylanibacter muris TaxID=2736290 RepID=A0ABX2ALQ4_9BACT|nr:ABC transporter permease [Xylanibacter muris]NPD92133.1 ABC transporter permease [Xylanibacter muris]